MFKTRQNTIVQSVQIIIFLTKIYSKYTARMVYNILWTITHQTSALKHCQNVWNC